MINRGITRRVIGAAVAVSFLWLQGVAWGKPGGPPEVLDRIPAEGPEAVIAVASLERLDEQSSELFVALDLGAISTLAQALESVGMKRGLDMAGSGAIVVLPGEEGSGRVSLLVLPLKDMAALREGLKAVEDAGLPRATIAGVDYWLRELAGGYVVIGSPRKAVSGFPVVSGQIEAIQAKLGSAGTEVASGSVLVALAPPGKMRSLFGALLGPLLEGAPGMGVPGALMGGAADPRAGLGRALLERLESDGRAAVVGVSPGPLGLRLNSAVAFRDGSSMASACRDEPDAPDPTLGLRGLAQGEFIFAGSMRTSHAGLRAIMSDLVPAKAAEGSDALSASFMGAARDAMKNSTSASVAIYTPPSLFTGGLVRTVMSWQADDPAVGVKLLGDWLGTMNGTDVGGVKVTTSFVPAEGGVAGAKAWAIRLPPGSAPMGPMLYGPGEGPSGLVAVKGRCGYLTWSKDRALLDAALASAEAPANETLAGDAMLASVAHTLPRHRVIEWYLNVGPIVKQLAPMMGMRPGAAPLEIPTNLPPIAAGLAMRDGAMRGGLFVPAPLLKLAAAEIRRGADRGRQQPPDKPAPGGAAK